MTDDTPACHTAPFDPDARVKPGARGTPVVSAGMRWLLADALPDLGPVWGRLYDQNALARSYDPRDLRLGALKLLLANYDLSADEAVGLARGMAGPGMVAAVEAALLGPEKVYRSYTDWVASALLSNGVDPASVPREFLRPVLDQLVMTGRAAPAETFVSSAEAAAFFRSQP